MKTKQVLFIALLGLCATAFADGTAGKPPRTIIDQNACPLMNCQFGKWKNIKRTDLVDKPGGTVIGSIQPGDVVTAITGEVHATPVKVNVLIDHDPFKMGDVFYLYYYEGVNARIWYKGNTMDYSNAGICGTMEIQANCTTPSDQGWAKVDTLRPVSRYPAWWVKVKTASGQIGWIRESYSFTGPTGS